MNILAVLGAVVLAVLSVPGESQSCPACWPRMVRGEAELSTVKENGWSGPAVSWLGRPGPGYNTATIMAPPH